MKISKHLCHTIPAEFLQPGIGERDSQHRLTHNARCRHNAYITAFVTSLAHIFIGSNINGWQRVSQRRNWLYRGSDNNWRSVANTTFHSPGIICDMLPTLLIAPSNDIMHLRTRLCTRLKAIPNFNTFDRRNTHERHRQFCTETPVPLAIATQANRNSRSYNLKYSSTGLAQRFTLLDIVDHLLLQFTVSTTHWRLFNLLPI